MITSKEILEHTGLKSAKTLTRWYQQGIIPKPSVRTHPSGRGKIAYWPDWVLDRCVKLVELQRQGHALRSAAIMAQMERLEEAIKYVEESPSVSEILANKRATLGDGRTISLLDIFFSVILSKVKELITDRDLQASILNKLKEQKALDLAMTFLGNGYNPVLIFDGTDLRITPDFVISHWLTDDKTERHCYLVLPLLPSLRKAFSILGHDLPVKPSRFAAPKIWVMERDATFEYSFYPGGVHGFELLPQTATMVGQVSSNQGKEGED
jgi:hypothetical protein